MKEKKKNETTSREVINTNENLCISPTLANLIPERTSITSVFLVSCVGAGDVAMIYCTAGSVGKQYHITPAAQDPLAFFEKVKVHLNSMLAHTCHGHTHLLYSAARFEATQTICCDRSPVHTLAIHVTPCPRSESLQL